MKKVLKIIGMIIGVILVLIIAFALFINFSPAPTYEPADIAFNLDSSPEKVMEGSKFADAMCAVCHLADDNKLSGHYMPDRDNALGKAHSANITQHPEFGINDWSAKDLAVFIRTGVKPDGSFTIQPWMPKWPNISDEDLNNVIAYLKSDQPKVQPSDIQHPVAKRSLLGKFLSRVAFKPYPYTEKAIARPDTTNLLALGEYLVNDYLLCFDCHSAAFETNSAMNPNSSLGYLGGGIIMETKDGQPITTPNITRSENGIGHYSYDDFENAVKWGKSPDNPTLSYPMIKFTALSDKEVQAMWEYLQTVDPL